MRISSKYPDVEWRMTKNSNREATLREWQDLVNALLNQIRQWSEEKNWTVVEQPKEITEDRLGTYSLPELTMRLPGGNLIVEPIGRDIVGADGRVDISSFPTMTRMLLVRDKKRWLVKTDARVLWPKPWGRSTFIELANLLVSTK